MTIEEARRIDVVNSPSRLMWWQHTVARYLDWVSGWCPVPERAEFWERAERKGIPGSVDACEAEIRLLRSYMLGWGHKPHTWQRVIGHRMKEMPGGRKVQSPVFDEQPVGVQSPDWMD